MAENQDGAVLLPSLVSASDLLAAHKVRLSTGCENIDQCLGGGVLPRGITEISGEASAGKTQVLASAPSRAARARPRDRAGACAHAAAHPRAPG
jgi:predicted ATP-dependent serine protease